MIDTYDLRFAEYSAVFTSTKLAKTFYIDNFNAYFQHAYLAKDSDKCHPLGESFLESFSQRVTFLWKNMVWYWKFSLYLHNAAAGLPQPGRGAIT